MKVLDKFGFTNNIIVNLGYFLGTFLGAYNSLQPRSNMKFPTEQ